jgi:hypothetical protein
MPLPADIQTALDRYAAGPEQLRRATAGLTDAQLRTPAPPGKWSIIEVVCHLSDFEIVYADRLKRVLAEDKPTLFGGDPDLFAAKLDYARRDLQEELAVIASIRQQVTRILRTVSPADFERVGVHSEDGPLTLLALLNRIGGHIPHHLEFIAKKRPTLGA